MGCQHYQSTFLLYEATSILRIPLAVTTHYDQRYWRHTSNREYTVKSAYQVLYNVSTANMLAPSSSITPENNGWWKWLWVLNIPTKIRVFMWRIMHDFLPTKVALHRHHVPTTPFCALCVYWLVL